MTRTEKHIITRNPDWRTHLLTITSEDSIRYRQDAVPVVFRWGKRLLEGAKLAAAAEGMTTSGWMRRAVAVQVERVTGVNAALLVQGEASPYTDRKWRERDDGTNMDLFR